MSTLHIADPPPSIDSHSIPLASGWAFQGTSSDGALLLEQVERILQSNELSGSDVLRRLLRFLAEKTVSGEADDLKEYTIAIDGLGKPASYDPRHTSAVRIQAGRLRQKLADYYRDEGRADPLVVSLPKGHFRLICRPEGTSQLSSPAMEVAASARQPVDTRARDAQRSEPLERKYFRPFIWFLVAASVLLNLYLLAANSWIPKTANAMSESELPAAMKDLWGPFLSSKRPLLLVIEDPLFLELKSGRGIYFRDKNLNSWNELSASPQVSHMRGSLGNPDVQPSRYYTAFGEATAAFLIGRLFGTYDQNLLAVARSSDLSPAQLASDNVLSVGIPSSYFNSQLESLPVHAELLPTLDGVQNLHPKAGEAAEYLDAFTTAPTEQGVAYALITHYPGPLRNTDVESFVGNRSAGYVGAVQAFVDPEFAKQVATKLRAASGGVMPRYYQVLLKLTFKDSLPTERTCVLVRPLK